jgi:hypothetical protein
MNIRELQQVLTDKKVSPAAYSLNRGEKKTNPTLCFMKQAAGLYFIANVV